MRNTISTNDIFAGRPQLKGMSLPAQRQMQLNGRSELLPVRHRLNSVWGVIHHRGCGVCAHYEIRVDSTFIPGPFVSAKIAGNNFIVLKVSVFPRDRNPVFYSHLSGKYLIGQWMILLKCLTCWTRGSDLGKTEYLGTVGLRLRH